MPNALRVAANLALPLDTVTGTMAVLGIRGSGKSTTATVIVEELLEHGQQVAVIDPTDVWWGLKSSADGKSPGYPVVILGGRRGDLPLAAGDGATIADFVVESNASVVCSLRHFESQRDMRRFVTDFARRLYFRKGQEGRATPLMCVFDEASLFVPQRVMGEDAQMVGAIQKLVRQGRASGFGVTLIDQRASTVNKDVLTQVELLVCHRTVAPQDRKALEAWIDEHDAEGRAEDFLTSLRRLPQGTAWFWSPEWLDVFQQVQVRSARTFDSRRTPKAGERVKAPTRTADVDLEALKAKLATTIEQARADDPRELRKRITELERELKQRGAAPDPAALQAEYKRGLEAAVQELRTLLVGRAVDLRATAERLTDVATAAVDAMRRTADAIAGDVPAHIAAAPPAVGRIPARPTRSAAAAPRSAPPVRRSPAPASGNGVHVSGTQQRILNALALFEQLGQTPTSRARPSPACAGSRTPRGRSRTTSRRSAPRGSSRTHRAARSRSPPTAARTSRNCRRSSASTTSTRCGSTPAIHSRARRSGCSSS
ncbi:protein of unknown function DUF87 (plasmid) [Gemmatirosa kalamazoonensis]|uniref:Helicase HerA central domain-containing protein n=1 Tax=Gemmatirosa kalamazoonensis TaxID=861299 RepID=W0RU39_9BACT|nr:DUF87 domain-containing protein [Gemmatirosa kalamazoonensis]AHG93108.1 protein of unknown function DUF87 [Gemmatirosa kalamazoonensis]